MPSKLTSRGLPSIRVRRGVIGVLTRGSAFLVIRRADGVRKGGCWCFPGGHLERGETSRRAIIRELAEELSISVKPIKRLGSVRVDSEYVLAVWHVRQIGGEIRAAEEEIAEIRWVTAEDMSSLIPAVPSNARVLELLEPPVDTDGPR